MLRGFAFALCLFLSLFLFGFSDKFNMPAECTASVWGLRVSTGQQHQLTGLTSCSACLHSLGCLKMVPGRELSAGAAGMAKQTRRVNRWAGTLMGCGCSSESGGRTLCPLVQPDTDASMPASAATHGHREDALGKAPRAMDSPRRGQPVVGAQVAAVAAERCPGQKPRLPLRPGGLEGAGWRPSLGSACRRITALHLDRSRATGTQQGPVRQVSSRSQTRGGCVQRPAAASPSL